MPRLWMPVVFALSVLAAACANDALSGLKEPPPGDPPPPPPPADDALLVSPESIQFTVSQLGDQRTQTVRILDQVLEPVTFTDVEVVTAASGFSITNEPVNVVTEFGRMIAFDVHYTAGVEAGVTAEVVVNNSFEAVHIPVTVSYSELPQPCVQVTPTSLSFGTVVRDGSGPAERTFTIANCNTEPVTILRLDRGTVFIIIPTPDEFQWAPNTRTLPFGLNAGQSEVVTVTLTPGAAGALTGFVDVVTDVPGSEHVSVNLSAVVEPPPVEDLDVHLQLEWDVDGGSDVDFHFYPLGEALFSCADCFFSNTNPDWGVAGDFIDDPFLDRDDLEGPGPENINVDELGAGSYVIAVHYYSDTGSGGSSSGSPVSTNATAHVHFAGTLVATYNQFLDATNRVWTVAQLDWPSGTLTELGTLSTQSPQGACTGL